MTRKQLTGSIVALVGALVLASAAAAAGEPKNSAPFTHKVALSGIVTQARSGNTISGEPKNQLPFTRVAERRAVGPDWFERYAAAHPYGTGLQATTSGQLAASAGSSPQTFRWSDVGLGAAATAATVVLLAASLLLLRSRRRDHVPHIVGS